MYLRRPGIVGRSCAAALAHVSTVVTPLAPAAENLGVGRFGRCTAELSKNFLLYLYSGELTLAATGAMGWNQKRL